MVAEYSSLEQLGRRYKKPNSSKQIDRDQSEIDYFKSKKKNPRYKSKYIVEQFD